MKHDFAKEIVVLAATAFVIVLNENPDALRYVKPTALRQGARLSRRIAETAWRTAMRLENEYSREVA